MSVRRLLSLDEEIAAKLDDETRRRGSSLDETLNDLLRRGLGSPSPEAAGTAHKSFSIKARELHARPELDFDDVEGLLDRLDSPEPP
jgi:hypothetical protein